MNVFTVISIHIGSFLIFKHICTLGSSVCMETLADGVTAE